MGDPLDGLEKMKQASVDAAVRVALASTAARVEMMHRDGESAVSVCTAIHAHALDTLIENPIMLEVSKQEGGDDALAAVASDVAFRATVIVFFE